MTTEKMSVHKALAELKMLDKKITPLLNKSTYVYMKLKASDTVNGLQVATVEKQMGSDLQSIRDMIKRYNAIKSAVTLSNAVTKITLGDKQVTVAEAIEMKAHYIKYLTNLRDELAEQYNAATARVEQTNIAAREIAEKNARDTVKGGTGENSLDPETFRKLVEIQMESREMELLLPVANDSAIDVKGLIDDLTKEIDDFVLNIDAALSVSNALTEITAEY